jgi:hypothetical protein
MEAGFPLGANPEVIKALKAAGWYEGRSYPIEKWVEALRAQGFTLNAPAVQVWREFGGLTILSASSRSPSSSMVIDPVDACIDSADEAAELGVRHGINYSPLGMWSGRFKVYIGEDKRLIASDLGQELLLGLSVEQSLEFVVLGGPGGVRREFSFGWPPARGRVGPGEYYSTGNAPIAVIQCTATELPLAGGLLFAPDRDSSGEFEWSAIRLASGISCVLVWDLHSSEVKVFADPERINIDELARELGIRRDLVYLNEM